MAKPGKFKPNKGALKRVKVTGTGKIKRSRANMSHLMSAMSPKRRRKGRSAAMCKPSEQKRFRQMLGLQ